MTSHSGETPAVRDVRPNESCYCGSGATTKRGKYFAQTHDRKTETHATIRDHFGSIDTFAVWADTSATSNA